MSVPVVRRKRLTLSGVGTFARGVIATPFMAVGIAALVVCGLCCGVVSLLGFSTRREYNILEVRI